MCTIGSKSSTTSFESQIQIVAIYFIYIKLKFARAMLDQYFYFILLNYSLIELRDSGTILMRLFGYCAVLLKPIVRTFFLVVGMSSMKSKRLGSWNFPAHNNLPEHSISWTLSGYVHGLLWQHALEVNILALCSRNFDTTCTNYKWIIIYVL